MDQTLWPEFKRLDETLQSYLGEVTDRIIAAGIWADNSEPEVRQKLLAGEGRFAAAE